MPTTFPFSSIVTSTEISPWTFAARAENGYTTGGAESKRGCCTPVDVRTAGGAAGPLDCAVSERMPLAAAIGAARPTSGATATVGFAECAVGADIESAATAGPRGAACFGAFAGTVAGGCVLRGFFAADWVAAEEEALAAVGAGLLAEFPPDGSTVDAAGADAEDVVWLDVVRFSLFPAFFSQR